MYTLYSRPGTGGFAVEAALIMAGVPFTLVNVEKGAVDDAFRAISPLGQVPALTLPDGRTMTESAAICMLIADLHPASGLSPDIRSPERPDFLRWMVFMSSSIYAADLRYFYAERYTANPSGIEGVKAAALDEMDGCFAIVERWLAGRDFLVGDTLSIADVYLLMLAHWHPVGERPRPEWQNIVAHAERLKALPVIAKLNASHRMW